VFAEAPKGLSTAKPGGAIVPGGPQSTLSVGPEVKREFPVSSQVRKKWGVLPRDEEYAMESGQFVRGGLKWKQ
jgi:hypothetical protein